MSQKRNSVLKSVGQEVQAQQRKSVLQPNIQNHHEEPPAVGQDYAPSEAFDEQEEYGDDNDGNNDDGQEEGGDDVSQSVENSEGDGDHHMQNYAKPYNPYGNQPNQQEPYMNQGYGNGTKTADNSMMNPSMINQGPYYNAQMGMPVHDMNQSMNNSMMPIMVNGQQYTENGEDLPTMATSRLPQEVRCPTCGRRGITTIQGVVGTGTVTVAVALCFCGCFVCSCVPCCMEECKDIQHTCSNCGAEVGVKEFTVSLF